MKCSMKKFIVKVSITIFFLLSGIFFANFASAGVQYQDRQSALLYVIFLVFGVVFVAVSQIGRPLNKSSFYELDRDRREYKIYKKA